MIKSILFLGFIWLALPVDNKKIAQKKLYPHTSNEILTLVLIDI